MRPNDTGMIQGLGARKLLAQHDLPSIVQALRLEPALRNVEPDRDDLHRLSLLHSSAATINDAAIRSPPAAGIHLITY